MLASTLLSRLVTRTSLHGFSPKLLKGLEIHVQLDDRAFRLLLSLLRLLESRSKAFGLYYLHFQLQKERPLPNLGLDLLCQDRNFV